MTSPSGPQELLGEEGQMFLEEKECGLVNSFLCLKNELLLLLPHTQLLCA